MRKTIQSILVLWTVFFGATVFADGGGGGMDVTGCRMPVGDFTLMFSAYQPQLTGNTKYCTKIPGLGSTNLVFDYESIEGTTAQKSKMALDQQIKEMTVEVTVAKGGQTIFNRPPERMKRGVIESVVNFTEPGAYEVEVKLTDPNGKTIENHMTLDVGRDAGASLRTMIIAGVVILAVVYFIYLSSAGFRKQVDALLGKLKNF